MRWFLAIAVVDTLFLFTVAMAAQGLWPHQAGLYNPVALFALVPFTFAGVVVIGGGIGLPLHFLATRYLPQRMLTFVGVGTLGGLLAVLFVPVPYFFFTTGLWAAGASTGALSGLLWWRWVRAPDLREEHNG